MRWHSNINNDAGTKRKVKRTVSCKIGYTKTSALREMPCSMANTWLLPILLRTLYGNRNSRMRIYIGNLYKQQDMTLEQFETLKTYKRLWEHYFTNFTIGESMAAQLNGLSETITAITGNVFSLSCSACKDDLLRYARNLYHETEPQFKTDETKKTTPAKRGRK